jgi:hypothetical protein
MDWEKVAENLEQEYRRLQEAAAYAFPNDPATQQEMKARASIALMLARALRAGIEPLPS